jgi:hypothetical protein
MMRIICSYYRRLSFLLLAIILILLAAACPSYAISISLNSIASVDVGEEFDVIFEIDGLTSASMDSLSAFDIDVLFDNTFLSLTGYSFVDSSTGINQLELTELGSLTFDGDVIDLGGGVIDAYGVSGNSDIVLDSNQAGTFTFLTLTFEALSAADNVAIGIDMNDPFLFFLDSWYGDLQIDTMSFTSLQISDSNSAPVPEPSTLLLIATGIAACLSLKREGRLL